MTLSRIVGSSTTMKSQHCTLAPDGAHRPQSTMRCKASRPMVRPASNFLTLRRSRMTSWNSGSSGMFISRSRPEPSSGAVYRDDRASHPSYLDEQRKEAPPVKGAVHEGGRRLLQLTSGVA